MSADEPGRISLVLPTFNRAGALRANLGTMLALREVAEVIVVDDGSSDETVEVCGEFAQERLRVISHPENRGVAAARNTGVEAAAGEWVLFGEDDCRFPADYALVLRQEAERHGADIVSAPLLHLAGSDTDAAVLAGRAPRRTDAPTMDESNVFPLQAIETPFLPARALVRRSVFAHVHYYDGFPVNGYREETDFFVAAARAGFRCVLTPETYCYQLSTWDGGQHHGSPLRYEYWALANNWRFLRRHGSWLAAQGHIHGIASAQLSFAGRRGMTVARGVVGSRLRRARGLLPGASRAHGDAPHAVIVSPDVSNAAGGVERMCVLLAGVLEAQGWKATVVGPEREAGRWEFRLGLGSLAVSRSAAAMARAQHPDLLITNGYMGAGYGRGTRSHGDTGYHRGTPRIHVYHGTTVAAIHAAGADLPRRERIRRTVGVGCAEALSARGTSAVVCVSESAAAEARRFYRVSGATVIPNGIDTATFSPTPRAQARAQLDLAPVGRYALFVGRLDHGKGAHLLMEACRRAGFELIVAGRDTGTDAINLGVLSPAELAVAYSAADCVLFPSLYEACSFVVLEALACGVPLLSTSVGWMPTLLRAVPGYQALCVEPNVEDIAGRLEALGDLDTAPLTTAARSFVLEHNSLERYSQHWRALLEQAVPGGRGSMLSP